MRVVYIDPNRRALYVAEMPDGIWRAMTQKGTDAPRKLISSYVKAGGYATEEEAQHDLDLYVSNARNGSSWAQWDVLVNGKNVTWDEYSAMHRGELAAPPTVPEASIVTLQTIEYRIAIHMQGAYSEMLEVGRCLDEAKESGLVPHGQWEEWVRRNTGMSERQAQKLMQAARSVHAGSAMERLPISKIQAILTLPEPEREPMAEKAAGGDMSLRALQEEIRRLKLGADAKAQKLETQLKAAKRDAEAYLAAKHSLERGERDLRDQLKFRRADIDRLEKELEDAKAAAPKTGISPEAQAEIDRLTEELRDAEAYAERQAEERQSAQSALLSTQAQAARGETSADGLRLTASDMAAAVRSFIGAVGVMPHMGMALAWAGEAERRDMLQYVDMVAAWVDGARRALGTVIISGDSEEAS